jgi:hypothetical protein
VRGFHRPYPPVRARVPIYLAGVGPGMVRLAAPYHFLPPEVTREQQQRILELLGP